jgi:hypothetical protein
MRVEAELEPTGKVSVQLVIETLGKIRKISDALEGDLRKLQLLIEDYQRRSLDLKTHLEKLIREDLPDLYPESPLQVQDDLRALDVLGPNLEQTAEGARIAEAISYTITQALLNTYQHSAATFATVRTTYTNGMLEVYVIDDGRGFAPEGIPSEKTSLFKAQLKARAAGGLLIIQSAPHSKVQHGTAILLRIPLSQTKNTTRTRLVSSKSGEKIDERQSWTTRSVSFSSHTAQVMGFLRDGALVKSTPRIAVVILYNCAITFLLIARSVANTPLPLEATASKLGTWRRLR